jgi:hypothetical protein
MLTGLRPKQVRLRKQLRPLPKQLQQLRRLQRPQPSMLQQRRPKLLR